MEQKKPAHLEYFQRFWLFKLRIKKCFNWLEMLKWKLKKSIFRQRKSFLKTLKKLKQKN